MSANYTCNQFDKAYMPTRLGNWEVPKWHLNRPKGRSTVTKVIVNDRGHLLPGVKKTDQKHWAGLYLGTYQLPKRISKEVAMELTNPKCQTWMKRSYHHPFIDRSQQDKTENDNKLENICNKEQPIMNEETDRDSIKSVRSAIANRPAEVIETVRNCSSADGPLNSTNNGGGVQIGEVGTVSAKVPSSPALSRISTGGDDGNNNDDNDDDDDDRRTAVADKSQTVPSRRHGDAHRHHGLPDAIEDAVYRSLQTKRHKNPGLGLNGCWPKCSAVAYKSFNDPGPTQCSKLRVYRPKTSSPSSAGGGDKKDSVRRRAGKDQTRPQTCVPVMTAQQLTDIKLALCWDLDAPFDRKRPARPPDEPAVFHKVQQSDGGGFGRQPQNPSSVMGFVAAKMEDERCDGEDCVPEARRTQTRECLMKNRNLSAVMELIPNKDRDDNDGGGRKQTEAAMAAAERNGGDGTTTTADRSLSNRPRSLSSPSSSVCRSIKSSSGGDGDGGNNNRTGGRSNGKAAADGERNDNTNVNGDEYDDARPRRRRRRSPADFTADRHRNHRQEATAEKELKDLHHHQPQRHVFRPCLACDNPDAAAGKKDPHDECNHYKMAFKAGVPVSTPVKNRTAAAGKPARHLKVPKPRTTNSDKKKYVIGTLLPPFSMWPGTTARDYPEHWRLTSVYRQAFKPLELRKQPLLQTVYL